MAHNVTLAQVRSAFEVAKSAAALAGVNSEHWRLNVGSSTYGNTFAVVDVDQVHGGQSRVQTFGFTRADAYVGLSAMSEAFILVCNSRKS